MKKNFGEQVLKFNKALSLDIKLPKGISVMNSFRENLEIRLISTEFYRKYYSDNYQRRIILGINPGRLGAGATGIPFTDTKRLLSHCGISTKSVQTHEPSSVLVYDVINAFGGVEAFYNQFYITSICPLGFVKNVAPNKEINYNYYDDAALEKSIRPFVIKSLEQQLKFGVDREIAFCFGTGKNHKFIAGINKEFGFFKKLFPLEHPRYIMQYKSKTKESYITKYLEAFTMI